MYEQIVIAEQREQNMQRMEAFISVDSVVYMSRDIPVEFPWREPNSVLSSVLVDN